MTEESRHVAEAAKALAAWERKPLLRQVYAGFYRRIASHIDKDAAGAIVEIGSGFGSLADSMPDVVRSERFFSSRLDLAADAYALPFRRGSVSTIVLFDVFHHLVRPFAFFAEARRVLAHGGRVVLFEPYISLIGWLAYGVVHAEPVAWNAPIDSSLERPGSEYYAAQGNATRLFFRRGDSEVPPQWRILEAERFSSISYLLSGGYSWPALYPAAARPALERIDEFLSRTPSIFAARCIVVLTPKEA